MKRNCSLDEISDGTLYQIDDLAELGCHDCQGCSSCCQGMGNTIVLDPFDVYQMTEYLNRDFTELLNKNVALGVHDGVILPHLMLTGEKEQCTFLNQEGRCSIHAGRPGICRMFPLGRYWRDEQFYYILQKNECKVEKRLLVSIREWLNIEDMDSYSDFICKWHKIRKQLEKDCAQATNPELVKQMNMGLLQLFYLTPYIKEQDFYEQFNARYDKIN